MDRKPIEFIYVHEDMRVLIKYSDDTTSMFLGRVVLIDKLTKE